MRLHPYGCVAVSRRALKQIHEVLERDDPARAPDALQAIGYAVGEELYNAYCAWLPEQVGVDQPAEVAADSLSEVLGQFFELVGWGRIETQSLSPAILAVDVSDSPEVDARAGHPIPNCFILSGLLADFLGRIADNTLAVMEVECRSLREVSCRFLVGAPESVQRVYDHVASGGSYKSAVA